MQIHITETREFEALLVAVEWYMEPKHRARVPLITDPENGVTRGWIRTATGAFLGDLIVEDRSAMDHGISVATATALHMAMMRNDTRAWDMYWALEGHFAPDNEPIVVG